MFSLGFGVGTANAQGKLLEVFYPYPMLNPPNDLITEIIEATDYAGGNCTIKLSKFNLIKIMPRLDKICVEQKDLELKKTINAISQFLAEAIGSSKEPVLTILNTDEAINSTAEAYLKLHLLSHRLKKPHEVNLTDIFGHLPNLAWTNFGAIDLSELVARQIKARVNGQYLHVYSVDKFPPMVNYVVPSGVRIADTARVRLGAYLGEGTTVMHEGFINFNAGCIGPNMVEGRISAGVFVDEHSDLGGGCSTMGTLSGGGNIVISLGKNCLVGANAGVGIALGDRNTIEAGLYVTAGSKVSVLDANNKQITVVKARELSGKDDLLFRRNSQTGAIECKSHNNAITLNDMLHVNN